MNARAQWTAEDMPNLTGATIVVTGGNSGIGFEAAKQFARRGARVVLACRDPGRAKQAVEAIAREHPDSTLEGLPLDLASLASVRSFAERFRSEHDELHVLCNNAGVMALPQRQTADGFEMQLGTNHLGHFALTGLLLDRLLASPKARVVTVSSTAHRAGRMRFDDLQSEKSYAPWRAYGQSKLANLLFAYELQRRLEARDADGISVACHPGYAATNLQFAGPRMSGSAWMERVMGVSNRLFSQSSAMGALPTLYAATAPEVSGGDYIGPGRLAETKGPPVRVRSNARSHDRKVAARLWQVSEELTGVGYDALAG